jgi:NADH-quinone oxidoreductase subunit E
MSINSTASGEASLATKSAEVLKGIDRDPGYLIPALQALQGELGYLPDIALSATARHFRVPSSHVYGVATFYAQFRLERQGDHRIKICWGTACHVRGSAAIMDAVHKKLGILPGETTPDYRFTMERVACLGSCALAPVVVVDDRVYGQVTPERMEAIIDEIE